MDGIFLHLLADTLGSVGVIVSSFIIQTWGYTIVDPMCSFCISILIFLSVIPLIKKSARTLLQATPPDVLENAQKIQKRVTKLEGVLGITDVHFWAHTQDHIVGTMHVQVDQHVEEQKVLSLIRGIVKDGGVNDITITIEKTGTTQTQIDAINSAALFS